MFIVTRIRKNESEYTRLWSLDYPEEDRLAEIDEIRKEMPFKFRLFNKGEINYEGYCSQMDTEPLALFPSCHELKYMTDGTWEVFKC
jgi:hypothetical protein